MSALNDNVGEINAGNKDVNHVNAGNENASHISTGTHDVGQISVQTTPDHAQSLKYTDGAIRGRFPFVRLEQVHVDFLKSPAIYALVLKDGHEHQYQHTPNDPSLSFLGEKDRSMVNFLRESFCHGHYMAREQHMAALQRGGMFVAQPPAAQHLLSSQVEPVNMHTVAVASTQPTVQPAHNVVNANSQAVVQQARKAPALPTQPETVANVQTSKPTTSKAHSQPTATGHVAETPKKGKGGRKKAAKKDDKTPAKPKRAPAKKPAVVKGTQTPVSVGQQVAGLA